VSAGFPGRPDHPDFWLLAQAVMENDAAADSGTEITDIVRQYADPDSAIYMARQRLGRTGMQGLPAALGVAIWLDGLTAGMAMLMNKAERDAARGQSAPTTVRSASLRQEEQ